MYIEQNKDKADLRYRMFFQIYEGDAFNSICPQGCIPVSAVMRIESAYERAEKVGVKRTLPFGRAVELALKSGRQSQQKA